MNITCHAANMIVGGISEVSGFEYKKSAVVDRFTAYAHLYAVCRIT